MGRPFRPCPDDFADRFVELGWEGVPDHYGTNPARISRWLDESNRDELRKRRKNYVLGNRLKRGVSSLKPE